MSFDRDRGNGGALAALQSQWETIALRSNQPRESLRMNWSSAVTEQMNSTGTEDEGTQKGKRRLVDYILSIEVTLVVRCEAFELYLLGCRELEVESVA